LKKKSSITKKDAGLTNFSVLLTFTMLIGLIASENQQTKESFLAFLILGILACIVTISHEFWK